ncbi:hypothetical protein BWK58_13460 [Flavobacterium columnare]|nr:hypothetical protein BWK58_13460 [Flavobacterium columnare]
MANAQTQIITKKLQLTTVPTGTVTDKILVRGMDKVVKEISRNSLTPNNDFPVMLNGSGSPYASTTLANWASGYEGRNQLYYDNNSFKLYTFDYGSSDWIQIGESLSDAPQDGKSYVRKNAAWEMMPSNSESFSENYVHLFSEFLTNSPSANSTSFNGLTISGGTTSIDVSEVKHPGIVKLSSSATINSGFQWISANTQVGTFSMDGNQEFTTILKPVTLSTTRFVAGLFPYSGPISGYPNYVDYGVIVRYDGSNLIFAIVDQGVEVFTKNLLPITSQWYKVKITINETATTARAIISNNQGTVLADETANLVLPLNNGTSTLFNYIVSGWNTTSTAVDIMKLDYISCKFKINR